LLISFMECVSSDGVQRSGYLDRLEVPAVKPSSRRKDRGLEPAPFATLTLLAGFDIGITPLWQRTPIGGAGDDAGEYQSPEPRGADLSTQR
jgi:hypothetical protein